MGSWRTTLGGLSADLILGPRGRPTVLRDAESDIGITLPEELRELLGDVDGVTAATCSPVWPVNRIVVDNRSIRANAELAAQHMPFDSLLFFGDDPLGNLYAYPIKAGAITGTAIFRWDRASDDRVRIAPDLLASLSTLIHSLPAVEATPTPEPEPAPALVPEPAPVQMPASQAAPEREPVLGPGPEPARLPAPEPVPAPEPISEPAPAAQQLAPVAAFGYSDVELVAPNPAPAPVKPIRRPKQPVGVAVGAITPPTPEATATTANKSPKSRRALVTAAAIVVVLGFGAGLTVALTRDGSSGSSTASGPTSATTNATGGKGDPKSSGSSRSTRDTTTMLSNTTAAPSTSTESTSAPTPIPELSVTTAVAPPAVRQQAGIVVAPQAQTTTTIPPALVRAQPAGGVVNIAKGGTMKIRLLNTGGRSGQYFMQSDGITSLSPQSGSLAPGASADILVTASPGAEGTSFAVGALEGTGVYSLTIFINNGNEVRTTTTRPPTATTSTAAPRP